MAALDDPLLDPFEHLPPDSRVPLGGPLMEPELPTLARVFNDLCEGLLRLAMPLRMAGSPDEKQVRDLARAVCRTRAKAIELERARRRQRILRKEARKKRPRAPRPSSELLTGTFGRVDRFTKAPKLG
jgi:hypothetical protein